MARILLRDEVLLHLAGLRPRQLVQEMHAVRDLEIRQQLSTALLHPGRRRLGAGPNDGNLDYLAEHVVRHGKGRALLHAFHVVDDLLDLPGKNILPADIDHVLAPADDVDVASLVEGAQVPAPVIAVASEDLRACRSPPSRRRGSR